MLILLEYQNINKVSQRLYSKLVRRVLAIKKAKNTVPWTYVINDHNGEEIFGIVSEKELQKTNQKEFRT